MTSPAAEPMPPAQSNARDASLDRVERALRQWSLHREGAGWSGAAGSAFPVRTVDGISAVLKVQEPSPELHAAVQGLREWDGRGSVRLLQSDAEAGVLLLERLQDRSLHALENDDDATAAVGMLLAQLQLMTPRGDYPQLVHIADAMVAEAEPATARLGRHEDRELLRRWAHITDAVNSEASDARLLHWDLHFGNVLAATRAPWLAIDPEPLIGDPAFDLWPALDSGWSEDPSRTDATHLVRRRFDILTERLGLDRERAVAWTIARLLQNALWDIEDGHGEIAETARITAAALGERTSD